MTGYVGVYLRPDGGVFLSGRSKVVSGPYVVNGWVLGLMADCKDSELGHAVMEGLDRTELDILAVPADELTKRQRALIRLAKVSSFSKFAAGTRHVSVSRDISNTIDITPSRNGGRSGFFYMEAEHDVVVRPPYDDSAVGRAVRDGLARALP